MDTSEVLQSEGRPEGRVARTIETATSKVPSDLFLWAGVAAIAVSAGSFLMGKKHVGQFVGQWVPTVLILGLYNKLVKVAGHGQSRGN
jgi:membrane protein implicated in regulation of membrane protease activity